MLVAIAVTPAHAQIVVGSDGADTTDSTSYSGDQTLTKTGSNTVTLTGSSTYSGETMVSGGTLEFTTIAINAASALGTGANALPNGRIVIGGGNLRFVGNTTQTVDRNIAWMPGTSGILEASGSAGAALVINDTSGNPFYGPGIRTFAFGGTNTDANTYSGVLANQSFNASSVVKSGEGRWVFSGNNSYSGQTQIDAGTLQIGAGGSSGSLGSGSVVNNGTLAFNRSDNVTIGNAISGSGSVVKQGAGTVTLSANSTYSGTTFVTAGTLQVNSSGADFTANNPNTSYVVNSGATLWMGNNSSTAALWGRPVTLNGGTLVSNNNDYSDAIGSLTMNGGAVTGNAYRVYDGNTWQLSGNNQIDTWLGFVTFDPPTGFTLNTTSGTTTVGGHMSDFFAGGGPQFVQKTGAGVAIFTGQNTYAGETRILAGTLQIGNGGTSGSLGSGAVVNNATLVFNRSDNTTVSNEISGSGSVVKMGGDVLFNTTNTYSGGLTVLSAIAWVDRASALGSGTITMGGAASAGGQLLVDTAGDTTITNDVVASALATGNSSIGGFNTGDGNANVWTGTIFLGRDLNLRAFNTTTRTTFTGKITGNGGITVSQGRVTLENSANDYLGATTVNAGTILQLTGNELIPNTSDVTVNGSLTLASGGGTETFGRLSGNGSLSALLPGNYTLAIAHSGTATFDGTISNNAGTVSLVKNGSGTQVLTGSNTYTGPTTVNGGRLVVANTTASTTYTNNATLEFSASGADIKLAGGTLSGSGTIVKTGADGLWLGGNGATQAISLSAGAVIDVQQGYLRNEYGAGDWSANQGSLNVAAGATVDLWDSPGGIRVNSLTGAGSVTNGIGANSNLTVGVANGSGTFGGVISNGVGTVGLVKQGNGVQVLSGNNTYTGTTTVSAGKLVINGNQSAATGAVTVAAGAALGGSGTVGGATTIAGSHTPGNSPGVQTFASNLTYQAGSSVQWELAANSVSNSPVVFDQILVGGNLTFSGSTALSLAFNGAGSLVNWQDTAFWGTDRSWLIYDVTGTTTGFANLLLLTENWADASGDLFAEYLPNASFALEQQGSDVYLTFRAVPEPSAVVLVGIGLVGLVLVRRRAAVRRRPICGSEQIDELLRR